MTEADWNSCTDPAAMLEFLRSSGTLSDRKARLFAVACCRRIWHLLTDERSQEAVKVAERFADGLADHKDLTRASKAAQQPCYDFVNRADGWDDFAMAAIAAENAAGDSERYLLKVISHAAVLGDHHDAAKQNIRQMEQCCLVREVFGNPFRLVTIAQSCPTPAQAAYDDRLKPSGILKADRLTVLAAALSDVGCDDSRLLDHLRGPGPHVRGCWALDLVLGMA